MRNQLIILFLLIAPLAKAQVKPVYFPPKPFTPKISCRPPIVESFPELEGLDNFIYANFKLPEVTRDSGKNGTIMVVFNIDTLGKMEDIRIFKNEMDEACAEEVLRVFKLASEHYTWNAYIVDGEKEVYKVRYPIIFKIPKDEDE